VYTFNGSDEQVRLEEQRKWLDQEMEVVLQQRKAVEELEKVPSASLAYHYIIT